MTIRRNLWAWTNHAALNVGAAIRCVYHTVLPPQVDHPFSDIEHLAKSNPIREFLVGAGVVPHRDLGA
jgi:hypothetical protein